MDSLARLIRAFALVFTLGLLCGGVWAHGSVAVKTGTPWKCVDSADVANFAISLDANLACDEMVGKKAKTTQSGLYTYTFSYGPMSCGQGATSRYCSSTVTRSAIFTTGGASAGTTTFVYSASAGALPPQSTCASGGVLTTLNGSSTEVCPCPIGTRPETSGGEAICRPYQCGMPGSYSPVTQPDIGVATVGNACMAGCLVKPASIKAGTDGKLWATWPFYATGQTCDGKPDERGEPIYTPDSKIMDPPVPCGANQCPGTVNGASICVPCKGTQVDGPSTAASGVTPGKDPAGEIKGSETKTECTGTQCTTTTTHKDANGNVIGTETKTQEKESFCQQNPTLQICKEGRFGGACSSGFTCDGDAVQCALAKEVHRSSCEWEKVDPITRSVGEAAIATNGEARPFGHPGANAETSSVAFSSRIDQTDRLPGGGCPVDVAFTGAFGRSFVIPFSSMCSKLQLIGQLAVAVSMLAAAFIVFK